MSSEIVGGMSFGVSFAVNLMDDQHKTDTEIFCLRLREIAM